MDKDDLIRHLDRTLKIRALFAFEDEPSPEDDEGAFLREAIELVRRQPAAAEALGAPDALLGPCLGEC
jgi:hypothetical protein